MKAYEAAKKLDIPTKEFLETYGVKSHLSKLPAELEAELFGDEKKIETVPEPTQTVDTAEAVVVEITGREEGLPETTGTGNNITEQECPYTEQQILRSCRLLGNKSPCWAWRHMVNG